MNFERFTSIFEIPRHKLLEWGRYLAYGGLVVGSAYVLATILTSLLMDHLMTSALAAFSRMSGSANAATANISVSSSSDNYRDIVKAIKDRNLFNSSGEFPDEKTPNAEDDDTPENAFDINAACVKPTMNIELLGTIYLDNGNSVATVQEQGYSESDAYREGDLIVGNEQASIVKIERNRIIINNGGVKECLELSSTTKKEFGSGGFPEAAPFNPPNADSEAGAQNGSIPGAPGAGNNEVVLDEKYVQDELGPGFGTIIQKARLVPNTTPEGTNGFKIFSIDSGSLLAKVGLKNGDIITQVNDTSLKQPEQGFAFYQALQDEKEVRVHILRGGTTPMTLTVRVR